MTTDSFTRREFIATAAAGAMLAGDAAPAKADELTGLTIAEAGRRIASRELSPVELTRAYLERIERLNPRINAYITVTAEQALSQARELEVELAKGRSRGPLHGIPIGLKDNIDTAGIRTTAASAVYADRVPTENAPVVDRLREAGAIFLGKLNMHEFAYGGTCTVTHYGAIHNPWNLDYTPGGSSGGSGAAVAASMCAGALGTDTAASVRLPAAYCGVVGLKATHGLASIRNIVPLSETHDHVGPLARSVEDCWLLMQPLVGFDPLDPVSVRAERNPLQGAIPRDVASLRIGIPRTPFFVDLDADTEQAVQGAITLLKGMTRGVADVELPDVNSFPVLSAEIYQYHARLLADPAKRALYQPLTLERLMRDSKVTAVDYIESRRNLMIARNTIATTFQDVEVLVTPTVMRPPLSIEAALKHDIDDFFMIRNTLPFDVFGIPTISVPCGFTRAGLPIGLQISAPRFEEGRVFALAQAYEQATDWHRRAPALG
jgi:aspartyl-tRNA(Asn)/glutamyl-tRNA(Gln) amidotransferase subunit A